MKRLFTILLAAGILAACGTRPEATVDGTIVGVVDGTEAYLLDYSKARLDSTVVVDGKFHFDIAKAYPDLAFLRFDGVNYLFPFIVEPGKITGALDFDAPPSTWSFTGTATNDAKRAFNEEVVAIEKKLIEQSFKLDDAVEGTPEFDELKRQFDEFRAELRQNQDKMRRNGDAKIRETPNTVFAAYLMHDIANAFTTSEMLDSALTVIAGAPANAFTDRLKGRRDLLAASAVGQPAPDFTQAQPDGTPLSLSSLRGKLVLIDFWASWCGPCRAENPNVVAMYNRFKDKGFEILGVSLDTNREAWLKAIDDDGLAWRHVSDLGGWNNVVAQQYVVRAIPHTVLVGADGVIVAKNLRGAALEAKVAEILTGEKIEFPVTAAN